MRYLPLILVLLVFAAPVFGAASYLGSFSGNIYTPDGVVVPTGTAEISYHDTLNLFGGTDVTAFGLMYGLAPNLEVGVSFLNDGASDTALSGKYRLVPETADVPTVLIGVFDISNAVDFLSTNPGFYIVLSKNITALASDITGEPSKPVRLSVGAGGGVFNGIFAGLDWTLEPRLSLMAEFNGGRIGGEANLFSAGVRWAATPDLRLNAAFAGFKQFAFGASYRAALD